MNKGFTPEEEDAGDWGDIRPPPFVLCLTLVGVPLVAAVSASEVVAGGGPSL